MSASKTEGARAPVSAADPDFFRELVDDLRFVLNEAAGQLVPAFAGERSPLEIDFLYRPATAAPARAPRTTQGAVRETRAPAEAAPRREQTVNARCALCPDRMYPVRRYRRTGRKPILMLHYNGAFGTKQKPDRSDKLLFATPEEDGLFTRMLQAAGLALDDLYYQEYPACHFNDSRSLPEEWTARATHCLGHVNETIRQFDIRVLLLTGPAAIFLLSEDKAREHAENGLPLALPLADRQVQTLVLRSPAALLALEQKREKLKSAGPEKEAEYQKTVQEEKRIKSAILASLKKNLV